MTLNNSPAVENVFAKTPLTGTIINYEIPKSDDPNKTGNESLKLTIKDSTTGREKITFLSMAVRNWKQIELDNGNKVWQAPGFCEYGQLKLSAQRIGVMFSEDIEPIPEEDQEEGGQKINFFELVPEPDIFDYWIRLGVRDSKDKKTGKTYQNYTVEYFGKNAPDTTQTGTAATQAHPAKKELSPAEVRKAKIAATKPQEASKPAETSKQAPPEKRKSQIHTQPAVTISEQFGVFIAELAYKIGNFTKRDIIKSAFDFEWKEPALSYFAGEDNQTNVANLYQYLEAFINDKLITVTPDGKFSFVKEK